MADVDVGDCIDLLAARRADAGDPALPRERARAAQVPVGRAGGGAAEAGDRAQGRPHAGGGRGGGDPHRRARRAPTRSSRRRCARAGMLRVRGLAELFAAAETAGALPAAARGPGSRIVTNGGGAGVLAVDRLDGGRRHARRAGAGDAGALDAALPPAWSRGNPVDLGRRRAAGGATPRRSTALAADPGVDALLVMHCPTALGRAASRPRRRWRDGSRAARSARKPVLACWMGGATARGGAARAPGSAASPATTRRRRRPRRSAT